MKEKEKRRNKKTKKLRIKELEKKIVPSPFAVKKTPMPPPYAPGTCYGLAKKANIVT